MTSQLFQAQNTCVFNLVSFPVLSQIKPQVPILLTGLPVLIRHYSVSLDYTLDSSVEYHPNPLPSSL